MLSVICVSQFCKFHVKDRGEYKTKPLQGRTGGNPGSNVAETLGTLPSTVFAVFQITLWCVCYLLMLRSSSPLLLYNHFFSGF